LSRCVEMSKEPLCERPQSGSLPEKERRFSRPHGYVYFNSADIIIFLRSICCAIDGPRIRIKSSSRELFDDVEGASFAWIVRSLFANSSTRVCGSSFAAIYGSRAVTVTFL